MKHELPARHGTGLLHLRKVVPFVPPETVAVTDLRTLLGLPAKEMLTLTRLLGLDRVASAGRRTVLDMLLAAGEGALAGTDRAEVRYLIHAHTLQHIAPPELRLVSLLTEKLGLGHTRSFSMTHQSCVTGLSALKLARTLLRSEPAGSTALILIGDKVVSPMMRHIPATTVAGDAAAASLVSLTGPGDTLLGLAQHTLGEYHQAGDMPEELQRQYRRAYVPELAEVILDAVHGAGMRLNDISLVLPHNVNRFSWTAVAKHLDLPAGRIYLDKVAATGHCFGADPFVNLATARAEGVVKPDSTVLLVSAGQGGTFGAAVVRTAREES